MYHGTWILYLHHGTGFLAVLSCKYGRSSESFHRRVRHFYSAEFSSAGLLHRVKLGGGGDEDSLALDAKHFLESLDHSCEYGDTMIVCGSRSRWRGGEWDFAAVRRRRRRRKTFCGTRVRCSGQIWSQDTPTPGGVSFRVEWSLDWDSSRRIQGITPISTIKFLVLIGRVPYIRLDVSGPSSSPGVPLW